jgi:hypothetical protein
MALPNIDTGSTYGALAKVNYSAVPPANPQYDWSNPLLAPAICNVAGITQTIDRVQVQMTLAASTGALVLNQWYAVWKNVTTTAPVLARTTTGVFTVRMPSMVSDEYDASIGTTLNNTVNLQMGRGNIESPTVMCSIHVSCVANVITILTFNSGGASDLVGLVVDIYAR